MKPDKHAHRGKRREQDHRLENLNSPSIRNWNPQSNFEGKEIPKNKFLEVGWGRLIFGQTFQSTEDLAKALREEGKDRRDIALYLRDPHVLLAMDPQSFFLDPSHTFRLYLHQYQPTNKPFSGFVISPLKEESDIAAINRIYSIHRMVPLDPDHVMQHCRVKRLTYLTARDSSTDEVLGVVIGVDHGIAFDDPENGSSLWGLAVDSQASYPGIGEALVRTLAEKFKYRGRNYLDLSVMHDNAAAIKLYRRIGFERVPVFAVKTRNSINQKLFSGPDFSPRLNPYAMIIIDEARKRGIQVKVIDQSKAIFDLSYGGRRIRCRESLSEMTSAVAMSLCDDKALTRRILMNAGIPVPEQIPWRDAEEVAAFLGKHGSVVVKPARGEQGRGISVDIRDKVSLSSAGNMARQECEDVIVESFFEGQDLRIVVINHEVVAASLRKPPSIKGDGKLSVRELIESLAKRRAKATDGESTVVADAETERCLALEGVGMDDVLEEDRRIKIRRTANLHTGGTMHDVTDTLHPRLKEAAIQASRALNIPVTGLDFLVKSPEEDSFVIIEANERPGLANHEPQPTAQKFVDFLFPETALIHS